MASRTAQTTSFLAGCWHGVGAGCSWVTLNLLWAGLLGLALWLGYQSYTLTTTGRTVVGTVIENEVVSDEDGDTYRPIITYTVADRTYTYKAQNSSNPPAYAVGQKVTLRYNPDNPSQARINNLTDLWLIPGILGPVALVIAVLVNGGYFLAWRRGTLFTGSASMAD